MNENHIDKINLLKLSLYEMAELLGHTSLNPISLNLLCLQFDVPLDVKDKWIRSFKYLTINNDFSNMSDKDIFNVFREEMKRYFKMAEHFSDLTIFSFIMIISKNFIEDLFPLAVKLKSNFTLESSLSD